VEAVDRDAVTAVAAGVGAALGTGEVEHALASRIAMPMPATRRITTKLSAHGPGAVERCL